MTETTMTAETAKAVKTATGCLIVLHFILKTFLAGALYREFRKLMQILMAFLSKIHRIPS